MEQPLSLTTIKRLVSVWQERLNLPDWKINVSWYKPGPDEDPDYAYCNPSPHYKEATIEFLPRNRYSPEELEDPLLDIEVLVVHELFHIHFAPFATPKGSALETAEENISHTTARLLVALYRQDEKYIGRKLSKRASIIPRKVSAKKSKVKPADKETLVATIDTIFDATDHEGQIHRPFSASGQEGAGRTPQDHIQSRAGRSGEHSQPPGE